MPTVEFHDISGVLTLDFAMVFKSKYALCTKKVRSMIQERALKAG